MSAAGWQVSDSATPPVSSGWQVSDSASPPSSPAPIVNPNGEGTYQMKGPDGQAVAVPYSQVSQPRFSEHQFSSPDEKARYQKDFTQDPKRPAVGFSETARRGFTNLGKGIVQSINPAPQNAQEAAMAGVPGGAIAERAAEGIVGGAVDQGQQAVSEFKQSNPASMSPTPEQLRHRQLALGHGLAAVVPGVGPMAAEAGQQVGEHLAQGDIGGAIAAPLPLAATVAAGEFAPKIPTVLKAASEAPSALAEEAGDEALSQFRRNQPVEGENYTQGQHRALSGVLARGTGMGKDYFPKDVAQAVGTPLRQAAADNPAIVKVIRSGSPEESLAAAQNLLDKSKDVIDKQHQEALQPVANSPFNVKPVQDAVSFPRSLEGFSPEDAEAVSDLKQRLGNVNTLQGANDLRMYLNRELAPQFRKNAIAAGRSGTVDSAMSDALSKLRGEYYDQLEKASGQDFSAAKRTESSIIKAQEALGNAAPQLASKEALIQEPKGIKATVADALTGARTLRGGPIAGTAQIIAEKGLGETPLGQVQSGLQRFFSKLPEPNPPSAPPAPRFSAQARQLANPQLQLPADVPANAEVGPATAAVQPTTAPNQAPPGFSVSPGGTATPGAPAAVAPSIITPQPDAVPQLPAQAGPEGQGVPPPTPPTAPPLNQATARTQVAPTLAERTANNPVSKNDPIPTLDELVSARRGIHRNLIAPEVGSDDQLLSMNRITPPKGVSSKDVVAQIAQNKYAKVSDSIAKIPDKVTVYRAVELPGGIENLKKEALGKFWSDKESGMGAYFGSGKGNTFELKAVADKGQVDMTKTAMARMRSSTGHDESEVHLKDGENPAEVYYRSKGDPDWKPLNATAGKPSFAVTPEGTAIPQRPQLPAPSPATHEWSKSAWQAANPKRDLSKATAHARALGFKVVE